MNTDNITIHYNSELLKMAEEDYKKLRPSSNFLDFITKKYGRETVAKNSLKWCIEMTKALWCDDFLFNYYNTCAETENNTVFSAILRKTKEYIQQAGIEHFNLHFKKNLVQKNVDLCKENINLLKKNHSLTKENVALDLDCKGLEIKNNNLKKEKNKLFKENNALINKLNEFQEENKKMKEDHNNQIKEIKNTLNIVLKLNEEYRKEIKKQDGEIEKMKEDFKSYSKENKKYLDKIENQDTQIQCLKKELDDFKIEFAKLASQNKKLIVFESKTNRENEILKKQINQSGNVLNVQPLSAPASSKQIADSLINNNVNQNDSSVIKSGKQKSPFKTIRFS